MLEIKNITKDYKAGDDTVHALKGVTIKFRDSELVAVLGHSGCGKTTLLNIIGGLDSSTSGDLVINGRHTRQYKSRDWDTYRNHSVGFIFQSYNLIPHQTVLSNVELALTLSGVSKTERRRRAKEALEKVGLGDQLNKRPNQMSGGQMQRVAIARALVNDPEILLADEPTGALDSETSIQIMELVKEIAKDRLVIMVTHNPELANDYATRIVRLVDGQIISDSNPYEGEYSADAKKTGSGKKTSMSFGTALALSWNNLLTKKGRTFLTSFAGSIGIIGIALILSLSNGVQQYINNVERSTLTSYPIELDRESVNYSGLMSSVMGIHEEELKEQRDPDRVYTNDMSTEMMKTMLSEIQVNNLNDFMDELNENIKLKESINEIQYSYDSNLYVYTHDLNGDVLRVNPSTAMQAMIGDSMAESMQQLMGTSSIISGFDMSSRADCFEELLSNEITAEQYDMLAGRLPESYNEVVVIVSDRNELSNITLYTLGLRDRSELSDMMSHVMAGETFDIETGDMSFSYDDLMNMEFKMLTAPELFKENDNGGYDDMSGDEEYMESAYENGVDLKVVGVVRPNGDSLISANSMGGIGYTHALTEFMLNKTNESELVKQQRAKFDTDIFTGIPFAENAPEPMTEEEAMQKLTEIMSEEQLGTMFTTVIQTLTPEQQMEIMQTSEDGQFAKVTEYAERSELIKAFMSVITSEQLEMMQEMTNPKTTDATYEGNLKILGAQEVQTPSRISIYAKDFDSKESITNFISDYNNRKTAEGREQDVINYTDYVGMMISSVSTAINAVSYVLIAFVAISLVVSSIMIGIITYISVLERTKEIGILRAIGASKSDVSNVFNAETLIVGFAAGVIGILVTVILNVPINIIIAHITDIENMSKLPAAGAVVLVIISMLLTLVAGLVPASIASKKDPVEALRTE